MPLPSYIQFHISLSLILYSLAGCQISVPSTEESFPLTPQLTVTTNDQATYPGITELPESIPATPSPTPFQAITASPFVELISGTPEPYNPDPHIEIETSQSTYKAGDTITLVGHVVDFGLPYYQIILRDEGVQDAPPVAQITYDNHLTVLSNSSRVLEFVKAEATQYQVTVTLKAKKTGTTTVSIDATGEVHYAYPGPALWEGGSGDILITVR